MNKFFNQSTILINKQSCIEGLANTPTISLNNHNDVSSTIEMASRQQPCINEVLDSTPGNNRYIIQDEISRGGMGCIIRVIDSDIRRDVAMKTLLKPNSIHRARFIEEAQITGQLEHPNIVPIHELGLSSDGSPYFTMKMIRGKSLRSYLEEQAAHHTGPEHKLIQDFLLICNAMAFAHSREVIHRDLKPDNIMLGDYGEVLVIDWGLAKVINQTQKKTEYPQLDTARHDHDLTLTMDGQILGTAHYMAPEQADGRIDDVHKHSDIYSLGAILYHICTSKPPARGKKKHDVLEAVRTGTIITPHLRFPHKDIPLELSAICMKALSLEPSQRYQSVQALHHDIERYLAGHTVSALQTSPWKSLNKFVRRNLLPVITSLLACTLIVIVIGSVFFHNGQAQQQAETARTQALADLLQAQQEEQARSQLEQRRTKETQQIWTNLSTDTFTTDQLSDIWVPNHTSPLTINEKGLVFADNKQPTLTTCELPKNIKISYAFSFDKEYSGDISCTLHGYTVQITHTTLTILTAHTVIENHSFPSAIPTRKNIEIIIRWKTDHYELTVSVNKQTVRHKITDIDQQGNCTLHSTAPSSVLHEISISTLAAPLKSSLLSSAQRHYRAGHYSAAVDLYTDALHSETHEQQKEIAREGIQTAQEKARKQQQERFYHAMIPHWKKQLRDIWPQAESRLELLDNGLSLTVSHPSVQSLAHITHIPLSTLNCAGCSIESLMPLQTMNIHYLTITNNPVVNTIDIDFIKGLQLIEYTQ